ncbi:synaptotagmin-15 [Trichonephila inaurata madagascariensis]|uniref:Synaptotagmin-15 n=1 Tax=Trichonephila inaurata madagascariensis TaxID=2747483 RepID=A0A8X6Y2P1_9ARAC|nr:synaptotagmin-15 [Trichonephila inaurata madagascariensis]
MIAFLFANKISSFSSSASDDVSDTQSPIGKQFRRPLGPSSSLDPTSLLKLTSECVQPRPALTRWHTVASPHCQTTAVLGTLDVERDSDEEPHNPPCLHGRLWFSALQLGGEQAGSDAYQGQVPSRRKNMEGIAFTSNRGSNNDP